MRIISNKHYTLAGIILSATIIFGLFYYLVVLGVRTKFFTHPTSIGLDVVLLFHILAVLAIVTALLLRKGDFPFKWLIVVVLSGAVAEGFFLSLNIRGIVWELVKDNPSNLGEFIQRIFSQ
jgi:hypothetical protein